MHGIQSIPFCRWGLCLHEQIVWICVAFGPQTHTHTHTHIVPVLCTDVPGTRKPLIQTSMTNWLDFTFGPRVKLFSYDMSSRCMMSDPGVKVTKPPVRQPRLGSQSTNPSSSSTWAVNLSGTRYPAQIIPSQRSCWLSSSFHLHPPFNPTLPGRPPKLFTWWRSHGGQEEVQVISQLLGHGLTVSLSWFLFVIYETLHRPFTLKAPSETFHHIKNFLFQQLQILKVLMLQHSCSSRWKSVLTQQMLNLRLYLHHCWIKVDFVQLFF